MAQSVKFTQKRVADAAPSEKGERMIGDAATAGLFLRVRASGGKSWVFVYRLAGAGRRGSVKRMTIGDATRWTLEEARREAARLRGEVADRKDPAQERRERVEARKAEEAERAALDARLRLGDALDAYERYLERRGVRDRANVLSALRRRLKADPPKGLGDVAVADIDRSDVMGIVQKMEADGLQGAAKSLRQKSATFLNWAADQGHIAVNPLAGMRKERETRAQRLAGTGRALSEEELGAIWRACEAEDVNTALGAIVRVLILTGQRRTETALMRWRDLDLESGWWIIPADAAKNGERHEVPLPSPLCKLIAAQPRHARCEHVFTNDGKRPVSGWSKLEPALRKAAGLEHPWTLHDLRRSFRSGLTRIGADERLAELMINHRPRDLRSVYDREPRFGERRRLADRWEAHLRPHLEGRAGGGANVVRLRRAQGGA
ncbi:MAG: tyrosine-type recombinase/integrase [Pseudomonadota bacterium]